MDKYLECFKEEMAKHGFSVGNEIKSVHFQELDVSGPDGKWRGGFTIVFNLEPKENAAKAKS